MNFTLTGTATNAAGATSVATAVITVVEPPAITVALNPVQPANGYLAGTVVTATFAATDPQNLAVSITAAASDTHQLTAVPANPNAFTFIA